MNIFNWFVLSWNCISSVMITTKMFITLNDALCIAKKHNEQNNNNNMKLTLCNNETFTRDEYFGKKEVSCIKRMCTYITHTVEP